MEDIPGPKAKCPPYEFYRFQRLTPKSRWLMAQRVFHGLDPITPELKEVIYTCTTCLMCQELCGVRGDGYGPWDITVAMREQITARDGPLAAHRAIYEGLQRENNPWAQSKSQRGQWASGLNLKNLLPETCLLYCLPAVRPIGRSGRAGVIALAKLMQAAGEEFAVLGEDEKCCGLVAHDLGFRREYDRLADDNLATIKNAGTRNVVVACGSCQRIWREHAEKLGTDVRVIHGAEFVAELVRAGRVKFTKNVNKKVTYHDSCHLGRGCGVYPRRAARRTGRS